jgi:hypothetical protein
MNGQSILAGAATVTPTQLGYVSGVTSAIQTQLNNKSDTGHNHSGTYEPVMTAASQAEMEAGTEAAVRKMSPLRVAQAIAALAGGKLIDARMLSAEVQSFTTTLASAGADLEFSVPSAGTYALVFFGDYLSSAATEGLKLGYDFTGTQTGVRSFLGMLVTSSTETYGVATALNTATTGTAGPGASTSWPCFGRLRLVASSSGTVKVCFATETASGGASVTLNAGFFCMLLRVNAAA